MNRRVKEPASSEEKFVVNKMLTENYDVYIGRPSYWGNPFKVGFDGPRGKCVRLFEEKVKREAGFRDEIKAHLTGKRLACFCASVKGLGVDDPLICHGQIYLKCVRGDYDE